MTIISYFFLIALFYSFTPYKCKSADFNCKESCGLYNWKVILRMSLYFPHLRFYSRFMTQIVKRLIRNTARRRKHSSNNRRRRKRLTATATSEFSEEPLTNIMTTTNHGLLPLLSRVCEIYKYLNICHFFVKIRKSSLRRVSNKLKICVNSNQLFLQR